MKLVIAILILTVCLPSLVLSQLVCHRCYGNSYCNDARHPQFGTQVANASCNVTLLDQDMDDPYLKQIHSVINQNILRDLGGDQASLFTGPVQGECLTATVHEPHDVHTLRTCVTRTVQAPSNPTLCQYLQAVLEPMNRNNGIFTCRSCNNTHFCNTHTLDIGAGLNKAGLMTSSSLGLFIAVATLFRVFLNVYEEILFI